jgi:parvulin-like peptidyl-prolyl isomerase
MKITINEELVPNELLQRFVAQEKSQHPGQDMKVLEENAIQTLIRNILLRQSAVSEISNVPEELVENEFKNFRAQFKSEPEFQQMLIRSGSNEIAIRDDMRISVKIRTFLNKIAQGVPVPPEHLMKEYYKRNPGISVKPVEVHAAHIVKKPAQDNSANVYNIMLKLRKELLAGADFAELAAKNSDCNDRKGGDLGFFSPGSMVDEFESVVFSMDIGEISPVFRTHFGYHIAKVLEIRPMKTLSFEECRDKIAEDMTVKLQDQKIGEWIEEKKKKSKIIIER